jgi:uncharacterized protein (DUF2147 family)
MVLVAVSGMAAGASAAAAEDIVGTWLTEDGKAAVEIASCGGDRCGTIVWLRSPRTPEGRPVTDANNPTPALRTRDVCGLRIVDRLGAQGDGSWDRGRIYDPEEGKSYDVAMRLENNALLVTGYVGAKLLGETQVWRPAPRGLARCPPRP